MENLDRDSPKYLPKLISRKIWVAENFLNTHTRHHIKLRSFVLQHWRLLMCNTCHKIVKKVSWLRLSVCSTFVLQWMKVKPWKLKKCFYLELSEWDGKWVVKAKKNWCVQKERRKSSISSNYINDLCFWWWC